MIYVLGRGSGEGVVIFLEIAGRSGIGMRRTRGPTYKIAVTVDALDW